MNDHDQLREQMWDLVYDLATPEEKTALCARIRSDPKVARLYAEVSLEADLIGQAAKVEDVSVTLPQVAPRREKVAAGRAKESVAPLARGTGPARWLHAAVAATALGLGGVLAIGTFWRERVPLAQIPDRIDVYTKEPLIEGVPDRKLLVEAKDADGNPASDEFQAWFVSQDGRVLEEKRFKTDDSGRADLVVKEIKRDTILILSRFAEQSAEPAAPVAVAEKVAEVAKRQELLLQAPLRVEPEPIKTQVTFDQDQYKAGDMVRYRVVANSAFTHQSQDAATLAFRLIGPDNRRLEPADSMSLEGSGIVTGEFQLPSDAPAGQYAFVVASPSRGEELVEANVMVGRDVTRMQANLLSFHGLTDGSQAASFGGGGLGGRGPGGRGGPMPSEKREERHDLAARSQFRMNMKTAKGAATGQAADFAPSAPTPAPDGAPSPAAAGDIAGTERLERFNESRSKSDVNQLADVDRKQLSEGTQNDYFARQEAKTLDVAIPPYLAGKPLTIEVRYHQILLGKQVVSPTQESARDNLAEKVADGRASPKVGVPLEPWVDGELEITYFDNTTSPPQPLMTQRVVTPSPFEIVLKDAKEAYGPGDKVQFVVEVKDRVEQAIADLNLGVSVRPVPSDELEVAQHLAKAVEQQVRAQRTDSKDNSRDEADAKGEQRGGTRRRKEESNEGKPAEESAKKTDADAPRASAPVTASATPPPPLPVAGDAPPRAAPGQSHTEGMPPLNGPVTLLNDNRSLENESEIVPVAPSTDDQPQVVVSNQDQVERALKQQQQDQAARKAQLALWRGRLGKLLLFGGVVMLVVLGIAVAISRPAKARTWLIPLGIAAASFAVGIVWQLGQPKKPGQEVAKRDAAEAGGAGIGEELERLRPMAPRASELPPLMENGSADAPAPAADPSVTAPAQAPGLGGLPAGGKSADGTVNGSTTELDADLRQPRSAGPRSESVLGGASAKQPAPADNVAKGLLDRNTGKAHNLPSEPGTKAKGEMPLRESDKELAGEKDQITKDARKPYAEDGAKKKQAAKTEAASMEAKRTLELSKDGELATLAIADQLKAELAEAKGLKDAKKQVNTIVWQPLLKTDENGRAIIEFTMPQVPGDYRLVLDVHGLGRVGRIEQNIRCEVPPPAAPAAEPATEAKP